MKNKTQLLSLLLVAALAPVAVAQLTIPGNDGSDGTFFPLETNVVVDLSLAIPGVWDQPSTAAGKGIYDSNKWVVVFKYRNVVIPQGFTVRFTNHPSRAPVVWLVQNNANIDGLVDVSGTRNLINGLAEPGPGGFRGGAGSGLNLNFGAGLGPGGNYNGQSAFSYGNARLLPLIGGSGGSATPDAGGGGGGAILVAAGQAITINGEIRAAGGDGISGRAWGGTGGGIRLIGNQVAGNGFLNALLGRIRIETPTISQSLNINPPTIAVLPGNPVEVVQPNSAPAVRLISVAGIPVPADPLAGLGNAGADLVMTNASPVPVILETRNMPPNSTVTLTFKPKYPAAANAASAVISRTASYLSGDATIATWGATNTLPLGHFIVQARAVTP